MHFIFLQLHLLVLCFISKAAVIHEVAPTDAYYWRDYKGRIPSDAFPVDSTNSNSMYIAQVLHNDLLIPGRIESSKGYSEAIYEWDNSERTTTKNIKMFCTNIPNRFQWVKTNTSIFLIEDNFIIGGHESKNIVLIGRSVNDNKTLIGKIIIHGGDPVYLHTTENGKAIRVKNFEVLSFVPNNYVTSSSDLSTYTTMTSVDKSEERNYDSDSHIKSYSYSNNKICECGSKGTVIINFN